MEYLHKVQRVFRDRHKYITRDAQVLDKPTTEKVLDQHCQQQQKQKQRQQWRRRSTKPSKSHLLSMT